LSLYPTIVLERFPPPRDDVEFYLWFSLLAGVTSFVAVWVLDRLASLAVALVVAALVGCALAYILGMYTYGYEGESQNGLIFRAMGGAIIGSIAAIPAWFLSRWARRRASTTA
jgi:ABC-type multidrug transport system permease subunit